MKRAAERWEVRKLGELERTRKAVAIRIDSRQTTVAAAKASVALLLR